MEEDVLCRRGSCVCCQGIPWKMLFSGKGEVGEESVREKEWDMEGRGEGKERRGREWGEVEGERGWEREGEEEE